MKRKLKITCLGRDYQGRYVYEVLNEAGRCMTYKLLVADIKEAVRHIERDLYGTKDDAEVWFNDDLNCDIYVSTTKTHKWGNYVDRTYEPKKMHKWGE